MVMMRLTALEEMILLLTDMMDAEACPLRLGEALRTQRRRGISISAMHAVLNKLELRGLLASTLGNATAERGHRRERIYTVTRQGHAALEACWKMHGITVGTGAMSDTGGMA